MVQQLGLATMPSLLAMSSRLTSGTTSGTLSFMRQAELLSITMGCASPATGPFRQALQLGGGGGSDLVECWRLRQGGGVAVANGLQDRRLVVAHRGEPGELSWLGLHDLAPRSEQRSCEGGDHKQDEQEQAGDNQHD